MRRLLDHPDVADTAVIVNEFGEIGLDHAVLAEGDEDVVLLNAGCLCCTVANSLGETLNDLYLRRAKGTLPQFRRVVIETTGLADPAPIIHLLMADRMITPYFRFDGVVVTVDALFGAGQLDAHEEAVKQAAIADRIALTKTDLASDDAIAALCGRLKTLNPGAEILDAPMGAVEPSDILNLGPFDPGAKADDVAQWLNAEAYRANGAAADGHDHDHDNNRHDNRIQAFCVYFDVPVSWAGYASWVDLMREFRGENLLRVKGLLSIEGSKRPYLVQGVQHVFSSPVRLDAWPSDDRRSFLVFITRDMDRSLVDRSLAVLGAPAGTMRPASLDEVVFS